MKHNKKKSKIYILFLFIGLLMFLYPILGKILNHKSQTDVIYKYSQEIKDMDQESLDKKKEKYQKYNNEILKEKSNKIDFLKTGEVIGYLKIEKIKLQLPIYEGVNNQILYKGVGHVQNTTLPTKKGDYHSVLVGHSGLSTNEIFDNLDKLKIGDEFIITILNETFKYKIYDIKTVLPNETKDLTIKKGKQLVTLVTCTPKYVNSHRLLIFGE